MKFLDKLYSRYFYINTSDRKNTYFDREEDYNKVLGLSTAGLQQAFWHMIPEYPLLAPHACVVSARCERILRQLHCAEPEIEIIKLAGLLHDIGKFPSLEKSGFHPLDGANWLISQDCFRLAKLVGHHSGAQFYANVSGLELPWQREESLTADVLDWVDMTTLPNGIVVTLEECRQDIRNRFDRNHPAVQSMEMAWQDMYRIRTALQQAFAQQDAAKYFAVEIMPQCDEELPGLVWPANSY
jgi:hypothetical protein